MPAIRKNSLGAVWFGDTLERSTGTICEAFSPIGALLFLLGALLKSPGALIAPCPYLSQVLTEIPKELSEQAGSRQQRERRLSDLTKTKKQTKWEANQINAQLNSARRLRLSRIQINGASNASQQISETPAIERMCPPQSLAKPAQKFT